MDILNTLIIALICITIGFVLGMLVSNLRNERSEFREKISPDGMKTSEVEIARLVRENAAANISLRMNNKVFKQPTAMNASQRQALEEALVEVLQWLGYSKNPAESSAAVPSSMDKVPALLDFTADEDLFPEMESGGAVLDAKTAGGKTQAATVAAKEASIVSQINDILQNRLLIHPLKSRNISLSESGTGEVIVKIGKDVYQGIDLVPDLEIRDLIQECVVEWEKHAKY